MKENGKIIGVLVLVGLLTLISAFWWFFEGQYTTKVATQAVRVEEKKPNVLVTEVVDFGGLASTVSGQMSVHEGQSVLDLLESSHQIVTKRYSFGVMVESIDGVDSGSNQKYWIFYVNGKTADVGAGEYKLKGGDVVEWRFEAQQ